MDGTLNWRVPRKFLGFLLGARPLVDGGLVELQDSRSEAPIGTDCPFSEVLCGGPSTLGAGKLATRVSFHSVSATRAGPRSRRSGISFESTQKRALIGRFRSVGDRFRTAGTRVPGNSGVAQSERPYLFVVLGGTATKTLGPRPRSAPLRVLSPGPGLPESSLRGLREARSARDTFERSLRVPELAWPPRLLPVATHPSRSRYAVGAQSDPRRLFESTGRGQTYSCSLPHVPITSKRNLYMTQRCVKHYPTNNV